MTAEAALSRRLRSSPDVTALVGQRIFPVLRGSEGGWEQLPAITYQRVSVQRHYDTQGHGGLARARVQVTCWAETWSQARQVAEAVRRALEGWQALEESPPIWGVTVGNDQDLYDESSKVYYVPIEVFVIFRE